MDEFHAKMNDGAHFFDDTDVPYSGSSARDEASQMAGANGAEDTHTAADDTAEPGDPFHEIAEDNPADRNVALPRSLSGSMGMPPETPLRARRPNPDAFSELTGGLSVEIDDSVSDAGSLATVNTIGERINMAEHVVQRYARKLNFYQQLESNNKGVQRFHAGNEYKKLINTNHPLARAMKKLLDQYDLNDSILGNKGELLDFPNYVLKAQEIFDTVSHVPESFHWNPQTRTVHFYREQARDRTTFLAYLQ